MGARLRVFLAPEEERTLFEIRKAQTVPQRVKDRAEAVRLNARGWYVEKIAVHLKWSVDTVRGALHRWQNQGLGGLWDAAHPGGKRRWQEADLEHLEQSLRAEGIWQPQVQFDYGLAVGSFNATSYIKIMDWQAQQAAAVKAAHQRIRVIVQDCGPIHTSGAVQAQLPQWEAQGLYIFYLPKYCSQMNLIESEWQRLKEDEIAGRMFEHELDLAYAVMEAVEARAQTGGHTVERFKFPSSL